MKVYNYNGDTKEYIGFSYAQENPKRPGEFLMPANATTVAPVDCSADETVIWNGTYWEVKKDYRGKDYFDENGVIHKITAIGEVLPENCNWEYKEKELTIEDMRQMNINILWRNYKNFQTTYVDAEDLTLATLCAQGGSDKGKAVQMWVMGLWQKYYQIKDLIESISDKTEFVGIDLSADSYGKPPYTIRELNEEASSFLAGGVQ